MARDRILKKNDMKQTPAPRRAVNVSIFLFPNTSVTRLKQLPETQKALKTQDKMIYLCSFWTSSFHKEEFMHIWIKVEVNNLTD